MYATHTHTYYYAHISHTHEDTSARVSIRAKLKHINQRSLIIKTNQDSLSNGEWTGKYSPYTQFIVIILARRYNPFYALLYTSVYLSRKEL
jgi:hypothetical protein